MENKTGTVGAVLAALGKAVCYLLLFLLCQVLVTLVFSLAAGLWLALSGQGSASLALDMVLGSTGLITLCSDLAALVILVIFFLCRRKHPLREVGLVRTAPVQVAAACGAAPILYAAVSLVLSLLPAAWLESYADAAASLSGNDVWTVLATVVLAPITEEVIFRGLIFSRLERAMPGWLAALLSAAAFGLCHGQAVWMAYAFVLGLIFAVMRLRTGSILPSMLAHFLFNGINALLQPLAEAGVSDGAVMAGLVVIGLAVCIPARKGFGRREPPAGRNA